MPEKKDKRMASGYVCTEVRLGLSYYGINITDLTHGC